MKKCLTIFLLIAMAISLCACSPAGVEPLDVPYMDIPYETVIVGGGSNSSSPVKLSGQSIWDSSSWQSDTALPEMSVTLFGETYTGKYDESTIDLWTSFTADYYECDNGYRFAVESGTQRVVYLFSHIAYLEASEKPNIENAQEYAISYAKERAAQLIEIDEYDMILETDSATAGMGDTSFYHVMFLKKVNGFNSMEYVSFKMSSKGALATYTAGERPGTFDGYQNAECTAEMVDTSVNYAMSKKGAPLSYYCNEVEFKNQKFVLTPNGEYGVYSQIVVQWKYSKTQEITEDSGLVLTKFGERTPTQAPTE